MSRSSQTYSDVCVYKLDRVLSGNPAGRLLVLGVVSAVFVFVAGLLRFIVTGESVSASLWWSIIATLDPVKFSEEETFGAILVGVFASVCGLVVVASLIGLVNSSIEQRLEQLQKGKSQVIADNHILVLNWVPDKIISILRELSIASRCRGTTTRSIVILSNAPKDEVEDVIYGEKDICAQLDVVVRTGSPSSPTALFKSGADRASCIIMLNPDLDPTSCRFGVSDREVIKTLLALRKVANVKPDFHVVTELCGAEQIPILPSIFHSRLETVLMSDTLARILVQTARSKGLAEVFADLLTFEGSELYFRRIPELVGLSFGEIQPRLYGAVPVGLSRAVGTQRKVLLNPQADTIVQDGDLVLVLSESGQSFQVGARREILLKEVDASSPWMSQKENNRPPECVCILGFSSKLSFIISEFSEYMGTGSVIYIVPGLGQSDLKFPSFDNVKATLVPGRPSDPATIEKILNLELKPQSIIVVACEGLSYDDADAQTISTVLLVNLIQKKLHIQHQRVICEILDASSKDLLGEDVGCDLVLSSEITSRLIAQISLDGNLHAVFEELFKSEGNEIYLKNPWYYCGGKSSDDLIPWLEIQARATLANEVAIGYYSVGKSFLNPSQTTSRAFAKDDRIIVISEDETEAQPVNK
jgi:hypothetical protein